MLLPVEVHQITLDKCWRHRRPYPPLGFIPFSENELGNGDTFGLYWPIGNESKQPLVAETWHDEWSLQPLYSSLSKFLKAASLADEEHPEVPTVADDPQSPRACLDAAREHIAQQQTQEATELLERAISVLPEYTDALSLLWGQYVRAGRLEEAAVVAVRAIISPPSFGARALKPLRWLCSPASPSLTEDPIWRVRLELKMNFGGLKQNADYNLLREAIGEYLAQADFVRASTLLQTYSELMSSETTAFQERYGFEPEAFVEWQIDVSKKLAVGGRNAEF
jgi:tetratricopeptide (TPR) repeat protein